MTTAAFYTALHAVDMLACALGREFHNHDQRNEFVATDERVPQDIHEKYYVLYLASRTVRYQCEGFAVKGRAIRWPNLKRIKEDLIRDFLTKIENLVLGALAAANQLPAGAPAAVPPAI